MDGKIRDRYYYISLFPGLICLVGNIFGSWFTLGNVLFIFVIIAGGEMLSGSVNDNRHTGRTSKLPQILLYTHAILHTTVLVSLWLGIKQGTLNGGWELIAALSSGLNAGSSAIVISHELIHRKEAFHQWLGRILLASAGNFYFFVHHLRIHHRWVATHNDAATARHGESVYRFFLRSVVWQIIQAWNSEDKRLSGRLLSLKNEFVRAGLLMVCWAAVAWVIAGFYGFFIWIIVCLFASFLLEYVNYIEHYGLERDEDTRVNEWHSWSTDKVLSRFLLIDLSRHADHHNHPSRPYHTLRSYEHGPILPGGYASLLYPALIPYWWFRLVHPLLPKKTNNH